LKTLKGFTWEAVKTLVKKVLPSYIRTEESVAKDLLLADREKAEVKNELKSVGLEVAQDETFYVQPALEEVAAV
jgi:phage host-nuclease inhibitor protein Gam